MENSLEKSNEDAFFSQQEQLYELECSSLRSKMLSSMSRHELISMKESLKDASKAYRSDGNFDESNLRRWFLQWKSHAVYKKLVQLASIFENEIKVRDPEYTLNKVSTEQIRSQVSLTEVMAAYIDMKDYRPNKNMCCPFHKDKTASLHIYDDRRFKCFGCGTSGTVIDFIMLSTKCSLSEAIKKASSYLSI